MRRRNVLVLILVVGLFPGAATGQDETRPDEEAASLSRPQSSLSVSVKGSYHAFWGLGLLAEGEKYGRPDLGAGDLQGMGGEVDVDYSLNPYWVLTITGGAYEGDEDEQDINVITGYGLATVKLQNPGELADYYFGVGLGGYLSRIRAEGTAYSLQPGIHALAGIKIHLDPYWSILLEDRLAFSLEAKGGFGGLNLGGNFFLFGCAYHF